MLNVGCRAVRRAVAGACLWVGVVANAPLAAAQPWYVEAQRPSGVTSMTVSGCNADATVAVGVGVLGNNSLVGVISRLIAPGVVQTTAYAPPPGYTSAGLTCTNQAGTLFGGWVESQSVTRTAAFFSPESGWEVVTQFSSARVVGISEDGQMLFGSWGPNGTNSKAAVFGRGGIGGHLLDLTTNGRQIITSVASAGFITPGGFTLTGRARFADQSTGVIRWTFAPPINTAEVVPTQLSKGIESTIASKNLSWLAHNYAYDIQPGVIVSSNFGVVDNGGSTFVFPPLGPDDISNTVSSITNDGTIAGGSATIGSGATRAAVWRGTTRHDLFNLLAASGVTLDAAQNASVIGSSQTGDLFVGIVRPLTSNASIYFAGVTIPTDPADCGADFNRDGFVDFFDFDEFIGAFEAGC
jgi:hypothetical protein